MTCDMIFVTCNLLHDKSVIQANKLISFIGEKVTPNRTLTQTLLVTYEICINSKTILVYHF